LSTASGHPSLRATIYTYLFEMLARVNLNDSILIVSLLYLCVDIQFDWESFSSCSKPIHVWLMLSYLLVVISRLVHVAATSSGDSNDFMLDLRQKNTTLRLLMSVMWLVIVPLFTAWTMLGTSWIWSITTQTPECLPGGAHLWFLGIWQALSYVWILVHGGLAAVAWYLERKLRTAEGDLRQLEDQDLLARWGQVSRLQNYTTVPGLPGAAEGVGLQASEIAELPGLITVQPGQELEDCPICLTELCSGEKARQLGCGHVFHRSCIDLWLYRQASCPLCKTDVEACAKETGSKTAERPPEVSWHV